MEACLSKLCLIPYYAKELKLGVGPSVEKDAETFVCIQPALWSTLERGEQTSVSEDVL